MIINQLSLIKKLIAKVQKKKILINKENLYNIYYIHKVSIPNIIKMLIEFI